MLATVALLLKVSQPILVIAGAIFIAGFALSWIAAIAGLFFSWPWLSFFLPDSPPFLQALLVVNLLILIGIPLTNLGLLVARMAFGSRAQEPFRNHKYWRYGINGLMVINIVSLFAVANFVARDFSRVVQVPVQAEPIIAGSDTLHLTILDNPHRAARFNIDNRIMFVRKQLILENVRLNIVQGQGDHIALYREAKANGRTNAIATETAGSTSSLVEMRKEGSLDIARFFAIEQGQKWRNQRIFLRLEVPQGKALRIDGSLQGILGNVPLARSSRQDFKQHSEQVWTMTPEGLHCVACEK